MKILAVNCLFAALLLMLLACAEKQRVLLPQQGVGQSNSSLKQNLWHVARFRIFWPTEQEPAWEIDSLLAAQVIRPILMDHANEISLWRFHRRALRDEAGHQFSFIYFGTSDLAEQVEQEIAVSVVLQKLLNGSTVLKLGFAPDMKKDHSILSSTSDPAWSAELREAWPHFAQGASALWLELISQLEQGQVIDSNDMNEMRMNYLEIENSITQIWANEGRHALLHHLNALFSYRPLKIEQRSSF